MTTLEFQRVGADIVLAMQMLAGGMEERTKAMVIASAQHAEGEIKSVLVSMGGRTGALPRSFHVTFFGRDGDVVSAGAVSDLHYARIQNDGGVIRAKSVRNLAIPLKDNHPVGKWPRHYPKDKLVFMKIGGKPMLWLVTGGGKTKKGKDRWATLTPLFKLQPSVRIPAKKYIETAEQNARPGIEEIMANGTDNFIEQTVANTPEVSDA